ncbi:Pao retrotransposon peptidase, partial [Ancylostoma caninum]
LGQVLSNSLYVDNVLLEGETPDELLAKYEESKKIFSSIGMNLRNYLSNNVEGNKRIREYDRATNTTTKILGICWNSTDDTISFECNDKGSGKISKRSVLSQINGYCYDPLSLLTPLMTPAEVFLQDLHKQKHGWDTELLQTDKEIWRSIKANISGFAKKLSRKISADTTASHTVSVFVDSSKKVYACSIYVTSISKSGQAESRLFTAKSKVAPINKEQTIPRLELLSIFIGLSLTESTTEKVNLRIGQINVFSDSTIALCWIHGTKRLPPTVSTLVQKIGLIRKRLSEQIPVSFCHVPTHENIADCATRGIPKEEFANHTWWCGPIWLNQPSEDWPVRKATDLRSQEPNDEEDAGLYTSIAAIDPAWPTDKISNFSRLPRVVAYCARLIRNASKQKYLNIQRIGLLTTTPSADEIIQAEALIIRQEQSIHGSDVLTQNKQLNVNYDENRILRRFGRLQNADVSYDAANPIHIPKQTDVNEEEDAHLSLFLAEHKISWNFIPPSSPWMGGKTIGRRKLTEELFHTTLCEIESVVNSRPLTTIGDQNSPCEILRPIDFVYKDIRHGTTQLSPRTDEEDPNYLPYPELSSQKAANEAMSETERLTKKFWTIWKHEYLIELRNRHQLFGRNHKATNREPHIGDVVIMDEDNHTPRGHWPLALIIDIVRSRDGSTRSVMLRTSAGREIQRPLNRIIPLEIQTAASPRTTKMSHQNLE